MDEEQKQALLDWAHAITARVQSLLESEGNPHGARQIGEAMRNLHDEIYKP